MWVTKALAEAAEAAAQTPIGPGIAFDWTVNIGNMLTLVALLAGAFWYVLSFSGSWNLVRQEVKALADKLSALREEIEALREILITLGQHEVKFTNLYERLERIERDISDLRRGDGFVLPFQHKR